jgi:hypothetical protein
MAHEMEEFAERLRPPTRVTLSGAFFGLLTSAKAYLPTSDGECSV